MHVTNEPSRNRKKEKGPIWGLLTFLVSLARLLTELVRPWN